MISHTENSLPGAIAIFGVALGIRNVQAQLPNLVYALLSGLNAATVGLIALAAVQLSERAITNKMERFIISTTGCVGILYQTGST
jgi:chromate transport protein ChrA